jgi:hypothetical protein
MSRRLRFVLIVCALLFVAFEAASAWMFGHLGANLTVRAETKDAIHLATTPLTPNTVLIVGNSLVLHGIDLDALNATLGPSYVARKETVVGSGYQDWLYGVPSLLDRGSHPTLIVLGFSPAQLVMDRPPIARTTRLVWTAHNLERYTVDRRIGLTAASNLVLQHFSAFFALRDQLRQDSRKLIVPGYAAMSHDFFDGAPLSPDPADVAIAAARLVQLDSMCAAHGARFAYLLMPTRAVDDAALEPMMIEAGKRAGVPVLVPIPNSALPVEDQLDGYHLNAAGAAMFSARTGAALRAISEVSTPGVVSPGS